MAAVIGAPYLAIRRQWDERNGNGESNANATLKKPDDKQRKVEDERKEDAGLSIAEILRGDSQELAKLRDAVK